MSARVVLRPASTIKDQAEFAAVLQSVIGRARERRREQASAQARLAVVVEELKDLTEKLTRIEDLTSLQEREGLVLRAEWMLRQAEHHRRLFDRLGSETGKLFGDPALTILLDLYVYAARGKRASVSSAVIASLAKPSTGLRYLVMLERQGFVWRQDDPIDKRRRYVLLTPAGTALVEAVLGFAQE